MNQEDHITRVPELGGAVACNGDHLRPHAPSDIRHLNRAHRRAGVRHNQDRVAVADDRRDRLSDKVAVDAQLDHSHREGARGEPAPTDAVHEEFLRGGQDRHGLGDLFRPVYREDLREVV